MNIFAPLVKVIAFLIAASRGIRHARAAVLLAVVTSVLSGVSNLCLVAFINSALSAGGQPPARLVWWFAAFCLLLPVTRIVSNSLLTRLTAGALRELRVQTCRRILRTRLRRLEEVGPHRVLATLTDDVPTISGALAGMPLLLMHLAMVVASCVYLAWLSWQLFLVVLCFLVVATLCYQVPALRASHYFRLFREEWDVLVKHFRAVTEGTKELKLHRRRRQAFFRDSLRPTAASLARYHILGSDIFMTASSVGHVMIFVLISLLLFAWPGLSAANAPVITGYTITLLYIMVPLESILNRLPEISRAGIAVDKIQRLGLSLDEGEDDGAGGGAEQPPAAAWESIELAGVQHTYYLERENTSFTLGPLDLKFVPGELVFVTGGNGSGKTTFAKLLTGLYAPEAGELRLNNLPVDDGNREDYRQLFSVVFSDFFLFETLLGLDSPTTDEQARNYLRRLLLDHKVEVKGGSLSATELSQGQRKRLALLTAYLEDRAIYVFDEWAADQDPLFKEVFYYELLPELKARGKTVIVISHDDRYYHVADRLIKLDYGKVVSGLLQEGGAQTPLQQPVGAVNDLIPS
jgi:putative pyoverdin transport system ATP-binding/permease protein